MRQLSPRPFSPWTGGRFNWHFNCYSPPLSCIALRCVAIIAAQAATPAALCWHTRNSRTRTAQLGSICSASDAEPLQSAGSGGYSSVHNLMWLNAGLSAPIICHQQPADCAARSLTGLIGKDKGVIAGMGVVSNGDRLHKRRLAN